MGLKDVVKRKLNAESALYAALGVTYRAVAHPRSHIKAAYRRVVRSGIFWEEGELFMCSLLPSHVLDVVLDEFRPASALDVGCGTGQALKYLIDQGVDAFGVEGSALAISRSTVPERIREADLRRPLDLGRRFDVAWCFEVAEHLHEAHADNFLDILVRHSDNVVMSAAQPGQAGEGHFNCQPPSYWIERMERRGYAFREELSNRLRAAPDQWANNMMAFSKR